jgi:hypothetical protein
LHCNCGAQSQYFVGKRNDRGLLLALSRAG